MSKTGLNANEWVEKYGDLLLNYTIKRVNDRLLAEDIVQETFLSAWKSRDTYKSEASEKTWLFAICKNKIIDYFRKKSTQPVQFAEVDTTAGYFNDAEHWTNSDGPKDWAIQFQQPIERKEFYGILGMCQKKLQQLQQSVFVMKYLEDFSAEDICKELNLTSSNYWVLIHRAKLQLRKCMELNWVRL